MARTAGKAKTRKSVAKRFKVTGSGKLLRRKQGKRHLAESKSRKRKRRLGKSAVVSDADASRILENLPFSR
jgi:large subunit ribosomal protein L35